jgi:uncharacterized membrane protein
MKEKKSFLTVSKILFTAFLLFSSNAYCCINCNKEIQKAIRESIYTNIFIMLSAFIALALAIAILSYLSIKNYKDLDQKSSYLPLITAAMVLGIGLGGFVDGIVFHQIIQWHEMLSNKFPPNTVVQKSVNMFWDGIFHLFTLLTTLVGIYLLWKVFKRNTINMSGYVLTGGMLAGWGIFNLIEGIIDHHILKIHNVREVSTNTEIWNYGFLLFGVALLLAGWLLIKQNIYKIKQ